MCRKRPQPGAVLRVVGDELAAPPHFEHPPALADELRRDPPRHLEHVPWVPYESLGHEVASSSIVLGIFGRSDKAARGDFMARNIASFDAPAVLMVYFPRVMGPPQWSDVGMWLQTVALLLREEGLDSCFQEFMALYANTIRDFLGLDHERYMFFCGMAIGYRDPDAPVNNFERERVPLEEHVKFIGF